MEVIVRELHTTNWQSIESSLETSIMMTNSLLITVSLSLLVFGLTLRAMATTTTTTTTSAPTKQVRNTHPTTQRVSEPTWPPLTVKGSTPGNLYSSSSTYNNRTSAASEQNSTKVIRQVANRLEQATSLPEALETRVSIQATTTANQRGLPKRGDNSSSLPQSQSQSLSPSNNSSGNVVIQQDPPIVGHSKVNQPLKGGTQRIVSKTNRQREYKLPSWFNYALYKHFYGKRYSDRRENELRKRIYLRTALKVFEQRALYRAGKVNSLSSVNEFSDLVSKWA